MVRPGWFKIVVSGNPRARNRLVPVCEKALRLLAGYMPLILESLPLNLLGCSRPGSVDFADKKTGLIAIAKIYQSKFDQLMVTNGGVGRVGIPEDLCHEFIFRPSRNF